MNDLIAYGLGLITGIASGVFGLITWIALNGRDIVRRKRRERNG